MTPIDWIKAAELDLEAAKSLADDAELSAPVAFHAQQAAEKSLKAVILEKKLTISKVHDLKKLAKEAEVTSAGVLDKLGYLNRFYNPTRYPDAVAGSLEEGLPTPEEASQAFESAREVVEFAKKQLEHLPK
jgi:HEPN domain-containing protein